MCQNIWRHVYIFPSYLISSASISCFSSWRSAHIHDPSRATIPPRHHVLTILIHNAWIISSECGKARHTREALTFDLSQSTIEAFSSKARYLFVNLGECTDFRELNSELGGRLWHGVGQDYFKHPISWQHASTIYWLLLRILVWIRVNFIHILVLVKCPAQHRATDQQKIGGQIFSFLVVLL